MGCGAARSLGDLPYKKCVDPLPLEIPAKPGVKGAANTRLPLRHSQPPHGQPTPAIHPETALSG